MLQRIDKGASRSARSPLLFVHGAAHSAQSWDEHFLDYFADRGYRAIAVDLHRTHPGASIADHVSRLRGVAAELPSEPVLIGHATGGFIVQEYLRTHRTHAAVLLASVPSPDLLSAMMRRTPLRDLIFGARTPESLVEGCYSQGDDAAVLSLCTDPGTMRAPRPKLRLIRPGEELPQLLIIGGTRDLWGPAVAQSLARDYHTRAELMPGTGHDMMLGPGWMAAAERIRRWLEALHLRIPAPQAVARPGRVHRIRAVGAPLSGSR